MLFEIIFLSCPRLNKLYNFVIFRFGDTNPISGMFGTVFGTVFGIVFGTEFGTVFVTMFGSDNLWDNFF